jgi:hypothetical protein
MSACKAMTKAGKPCKAPSLKEKEFCSAHDPDTPPSARFGSHAQAREAGLLGGRPRKPRVSEVLRERFEEEADEYYAVLREAREAMEPYTVGWGEDAHIEMVPDHKVRLKAVEVAFDRSYGRPKQATELTGADGGPLLLSIADLASLAADGGQ